MGAACTVTHQLRILITLATNPPGMQLGRLDVSSATALLQSLRRIIPSQLKDLSDVRKHTQLLTTKLLTNATLDDEFAPCTSSEAALKIVDRMERRDTVLGTATLMSVRAAAGGLRGVRSQDALIAHQSAPGGVARICLLILPQSLQDRASPLLLCRWKDCAT
jgi:hypothetical protein